MSKSYTTTSILPPTLHEHLKRQHSQSNKKPQKESLDKDRNCTTPEPPKKRKLEVIRQTSLDDYVCEALGH